MSIGNRIMELRKLKGLSRSDLADMLGVTVGAVSNYENGVSSPKEPILFKLIEVLNCDANYLFQDVVTLPKKVNDVSLKEFEHIKKYRLLDKHGKEMVNIVLDKETERILNKSTKIKKTNMDNLSSNSEIKTTSTDQTTSNISKKKDTTKYSKSNNQKSSNTKKDYIIEGNVAAMNGKKTHIKAKTKLTKEELIKKLIDSSDDFS